MWTENSGDLKQLSSTAFMTFSKRGNEWRQLTLTYYDGYHFWNLTLRILSARPLDHTKASNYSQDKMKLPGVHPMLVMKIFFLLKNFFLAAPMHTDVHVYSQNEFLELNEV